jgi:two-component system cell cycle sensor histidine kinase/response regulator CckA
MTPDLENPPCYPILDDISVPATVFENWQITADLLAEIAEAPAALIMRVHAHEIEVVVSSQSPGNVYHHGERAPLNTGLYCETVLRTGHRLLVPNALKDPDWDHNPDLALGMISYCGLPIAWPNGEMFGTICILDAKETAHVQRTHLLMERFRDSIQLSLASIYALSFGRVQLDEAKRALGDSDARFRRLVEFAPIPLCHVTRDGVIRHFNEGFARVFGYTPGEIPSLDAWWPRAYPDPAYRAFVRDIWDKAVTPVGSVAEEHYISPVVCQVTCKNGDVRTMEISGVALGGEFLATFIDLTERRLAEAALRESELKFRSLFETAEGAILLFADDCWVDCNAKALSVFGCSREQIIGAHPSRFSPPTQPDGRSSGEEAIRLINLAFTVGPQVFEWEHCRADGTPFDAEVSLNRLDLGGKPKMQAIVRDITERKRIDAALRESEDRFRGVVEGAAMPIFVSVEMKFSYLNPSALRLFGATTPEEVLGHPVLSRIHPDCHESIRRRAVMVFQGQKGMAPPQEEVYLKLDGTPVPVEATASPIWYQGQPAAVVFVQDITERKRMEAAHAQLAAQFLQAQKLEAVGQLAAGIAHDFNNLLTVILGNAQLAVGDTEPSHPARVSLEQIQQAGTRAKDLVQQILIYSRQQVQQRRVISLAPIITEAAKFLRATIPSAVEIVLAPAARVPPVLADATQIQQVILNLCLNAWHALEDQPGRIDIQLQTVTLDAAAAERLAGLRPGLFVCLSVSDTGKGMDAALIEHIFDPFFTTKAPGMGTGLGLPVVQGIVAGHDGAITVASQPGQRTTFHVYLPAADGTADFGTTLASPAHQGQGQHLLFLDDEESLVFLATRMLERLGYRVTGFTRAAAAVQAFRANPGQFDVVITDLNMPGASGLIVARELLAMRPDLPVLLCSGHVTEGLKEQAHSVGIRHVLHKPIAMGDFSAALHQLIPEP